MLYISGGLRGPTRPAPPNPYDNTYSSYIDLKCLLCFYVTVKIQFGNTSTHECSSYSPSARSQCSIARLGPPFRNFGSSPVLYMSSVLKYFVSSLSYCKVYTLLSILRGIVTMFSTFI